MWESAVENLKFLYFKTVKKLNQVLKYLEDLCPFSPEGRIYQCCQKVICYIPIFIYLRFLRRFQHCTGHIMTGSWKGRGNQYIEFVRVLYCKLPTNGKQLPAFPLEAVSGTEPRSQRWEARMLPLYHRGPIYPNKLWCLLIFVCNDSKCVIFVI